MIGWVVVILVIGVLGYVRFAPSDTARWHRGTGQSDLGEVRRPDSFVWREAVEGDGAARLARIDAIIRETPRTTRLAGSLDEGQITYVTRSRVIGFPDYVTLGLYGADPRYLEIFSRLRFGRSDLGVNAKRVKGWLRRLQAG